MEDLALVTYEMLRRGYSEKDILKVLGENFMRAFAQAEKVARIGSRKISGDGSLKKIKWLCSVDLEVGEIHKR